jgi:hypothetical protein
MANQTVVKIEKSFGNAVLRMPVGWCILACKHAAKLELHDMARSAHDEPNQITKIGDVIQCDDCDRYAATLARLRAMKPGDVQHSRFRTRDSRGYGEGDYYVYGRDYNSPSGVHLLFAIDATEEAGEVLRALQASPLSPTESR